MTFERPEALRINRARLEHLGGLGLPLKGCSVLEVGAGVGVLTNFFEPIASRIVCTDGRPGNVAALRARYPKWRVDLADLNRPGSHAHLGRFDVIFCYGVLYHIADPACVLDDLAAICDRMLLLETVVWHEDDGRVHPTSDNSVLIDQSLDGRGCHPARDWLWDRLRELFPFVYAPITQPDHEEYSLHWPATAGRARAVFVASRDKLSLSALTDNLPGEYERFSV
jgi:SAM-dependent methyltransferase